MDPREFGNAREAVEYLKGRIRDQKDLERRQKLENDRQLIRNRNQNEIVIPVPSGHDQELWFAKLESNGIWEMVFEFVTSPSDMTSAYMACEMFRKHLEDKRKFALLPKVFGVLRDKGYLRYIHDEFEDDGDEEELGEECRFQKKDVLNQRLVSKAWKKAAEEEFIENPLEFKEDGFGCFREKRLLCKLYNENDVDSAIGALGSSKLCSSLIRTVRVDDTECFGEEKDSLYSKLVQFLDTHGDAVWGLEFYLNLGTDYDKEYQDSNYEDLWNVVSRMPNLKTLELSSWWWGADFQGAEVRLLQLMANKPFPTISSLERCIFSLPLDSDVIVGEILSKSVNVKSIVLCWSTEDRRPNIPDYVWNALRNPRLQQLQLVFQGGSEDFLHSIFQLEQFDWPLKFLRLAYLGEVQVNIEASRVFALLSRFNDTLENVDIGQGGRDTIQLVNDNRRVVVHFPYLKQIELPRFNVEVV